MANSTRKEEGPGKNGTKVAVACQGGGMHAAFAVGVFNEILEAYGKKKFELVGLSGTSAGALCALMVWYGLAPKKNSSDSLDDRVKNAVSALNKLWDDFVARTSAENLFNLFAQGAFKAEEVEMPLLGLSAGAVALNPYSAAYQAITAWLPSLGIRKQYFDLEELLREACPKFNEVDWPKVTTRVLIGASEVVNGFETVFDSDVNKDPKQEERRYWRERLPLCLSGVAASGTLPVFREAQRIGDGYYWDGLYSQNPPVREFIAGTEEIPDELWIIRINPQQWPWPPKTHKDIEDRQNELMGNLSLNKELDFILKVNDWLGQYEEFGKKHKPVTIRTIKMNEKTADDLSYSSKFDRSADFMEMLRKQGSEVAKGWLANWPSRECYPEDAAYRPIKLIGPDLSGKKK